MNIKYPRTYHLPFSPGSTSDDKIMSEKTFQDLIKSDVIISIKMDGECSSQTSNKCFARSIDSKSHWSRDWLKQFHSERKYLIPDGWRVCGENLFATHSIEYKNLRSYFLGFSVWNDDNECLSWSDTLEWFQLLNITPVETIFSGIISEVELNKLCTNIVREGNEGLVIRKSGQFNYSDFKTSVGKFVRPNHVQTDKHWIHSSSKQNSLRDL